MSSVCWEGPRACEGETACTAQVVGPVSWRRNGQVRFTCVPTSMKPVDQSSPQCSIGRGNRFWLLVVTPQTAVQNNYAVWSRGAGRGKCYTLGLAVSLCIISRDVASDSEGCKGAEEKSLLGRQTSGWGWGGLSHLCFSQMMQFCWFHQDMTSSLYWDGRSGLGASGCPKWRYLHKKRAGLVH